MSSALPPFVSVIMPIRNEESYIAYSLDQILAQDYPADRLEIIVADGMSDDSTRALLAEYALKPPLIRVVDNPARITPAGLNACIDHARGDLILRIDGHSEVATDFISQSVRLLEEHPEAWSAGGPMVHAGRNPFGKAVAIAMSHAFGVGMATHRFPNYEGYVEGAQFPIFRRWVFERIGKFDERLIRNQDDELNFRISQAGGKTYLSPRVRYKYYVRDSIRKLYQQYVQYSFWRIPVMRKHKRPTTVRQVVPPLFFLTMLALLVAGLVLRQPIVAFSLPALYVGILLMIGISSIPKAGLKVACLVPVAMATMHIAYALGMAYGLMAAVFMPRAFDPAGSMSQQRR